MYKGRGIHASRLFSPNIAPPVDVRSTVSSLFECTVNHSLCTGCQMALTAELLKGPPRTRCREHSFSSSLCYARVCGGSELRSRFDAHSVTQFWFALEMTQALRTKSPEPERQILSRHITNSAIRSCIRFVLYLFFFFLFSVLGWLQNENRTAAVSTICLLFWKYRREWLMSVVGYRRVYSHLV